MLHIVSAYNVLGQTSGILTDAIQDIRAFFDKIRNFITEIITSIMAVFLNILNVILKILISTKDLFGKLIGVAVTFAHIISGSNFLIGRK